MRVRDEQVLPAVGVEVARGDAHARVPVRHAFLRAALDEPEAEPRGIRLRATGPGDVPVQPVRVEVVGDVEVAAAVPVVVGEHGPETVLDPCPLDPRLPSDLAEPHVPVRGRGRG